MQSRTEPFYINKTESLEEGIRRFPSIYIEGNAVLGKSVAVKQLLKKHPEVFAHIIELDMEMGKPDELLEKLELWGLRMEKEPVWLVLENIPENLQERIAVFITQMVKKLHEGSRMIFVSREKPQIEFLELFWKREMAVIAWEELLLSREEVRILAQHYKTSLRPEILYEKTGGWAGCVDMMLRLPAEQKDEEELLNSYEIRSYVQKKIISGLKEKEKMLLSWIADCPWINAQMYGEIWQVENAEEQLENIQRKGFLLYDRNKKRWSLAALFRPYFAGKCFLGRKETQWYEDRGYIAEALWCLNASGAEEAYEQCILRHYDRIQEMNLNFEEVLKWDKKEPKYCYLRGVCYYRLGRFDELKKEILILQKCKSKDHETKELLLNLLYLDQDVSMTDWLAFLEEAAGEKERFRLYHVLGNSTSYLCGIRELSGMFSDTPKDEKQGAWLWKKCLGKTEWKCYQLARVDYYLETERKNSILEEDWNLLWEDDEIWQLRMAKFYIFCKILRMQQEDTVKERTKELENSLRKENSAVCSSMAEALGSLYSPWHGEQEHMTKWLRHKFVDTKAAIDENNYMTFLFRVKGYLLLKQYDRSETILKKLIPYLEEYHRYRWLAEALFQYAIINWEKELKGQSVKNTIESMLLSRNSRYVQFYTEYGQSGYQVLNAYVEWFKGNEPEGWSYKKKYNYGNVLRMPEADYLQVILRRSKKMLKYEAKLLPEHVEERLTMMEMLVLQHIGIGRSNVQIAQELGIKLPTVKGHIYSLFKKLEVNSRVQAILRAKELGLLE